MLGGTVDAVAADELPRLVANLLADRPYELRLTVQPEPCCDRPAYMLTWQYVVYDPLFAAWVPLDSRLDERGL